MKKYFYFIPYIVICTALPLQTLHLLPYWESLLCFLPSYALLCILCAEGCENMFADKERIKREKLEFAELFPEYRVKK